MEPLSLLGSTEKKTWVSIMQRATNGEAYGNR